MNHFSITTLNDFDFLQTIGADVAFTYNGKARQGKVVQTPWRSKENNTVCRVECIGEQFPKTFTVDKMEFEQAWD